MLCNPQKAWLLRVYRGDGTIPSDVPTGGPRRDADLETLDVIVDNACVAEFQRLTVPLPPVMLVPPPIRIVTGVRFPRMTTVCGTFPASHSCATGICTLRCTSSDTSGTMI